MPEQIPPNSHAPALANVAAVKRARVKAVLGIVIFVTIIAFFLLRAFNTAQAVSVNWQPVGLTDLLLSFLLVLACYGIMASAWWFQIRLLGERFAFRAALQSYFLSSLPRYVPGFIWGYWGRAYLSERSGAKRSAIMTSMGLEVGLLVGTGLAVGLFYWLPIGEGSLLGSAMVVAAALSLSLVILVIGRNLRSARQWLRSLVVSFLVALVYVIFWILYGLSVFVLVRAISPAESQDLAMRTISGFALSWLAGFFAIFVPGGLGVREGVLIIILEPVIGGIPAVFVSFMSRFINILCDSLLFIIVVGDRKKTSQFKTFEA